jgi:predicted DNA-binding transcriptional regulator AlpA
LVDAGKAPQPTRFGRSVRWADSVLTAWEADGCQEVSKRGRS